METSQNEHRDRVYIDDSVMEIYDQLTGDSNKEQSPFVTNKDIFLLAACLGFQNKRHRPLPSGGKKSTIRLDVFREEGIGLLKAIAIAKTGDVQILQNFNDVLAIAEEYAHAGIYDVKVYLLDERGLPLWNLVDLISSQ